MVYFKMPFSFMILNHYKIYANYFIEKILIQTTSLIFLIYNNKHEKFLSLSLDRLSPKNFYLYQCNYTNVYKK